MELNIKAVINIYSSKETQLDAVFLRSNLTKKLRRLSSLIEAKAHFYKQDLLAPKGIEEDYLVTKLNLMLVLELPDHNHCYHCAKVVESHVALLCCQPWMRFSFDFSIS